MCWKPGQFLAVWASQFLIILNFWLFLLLGTQIPEDSEDVAAEEAQQKDEEVEEVQSEDETWEDKEG